MNVIVIGYTSKDDAICWSLEKSPDIEKIYFLPGNNADEFHQKVVSKKIDLENLKEFIEKVNVDLIICDNPEFLTNEIFEELSKSIVFGHSQKLCAIEHNKPLQKDFLEKFNIRVPKYTVCNDLDEMSNILDNTKQRCILKLSDYFEGIGSILIDPRHNGEKICELINQRYNNKPIVLEECIKGEEIIVSLYYKKGKYNILPYSFDYKKTFSHDLGLNTGGMGAITSDSLINGECKKRINQEFVKPIIEMINYIDPDYTGFVSLRLKLFKKELYLIEFNSRLLDPVGENIIYLLKKDFLSYIENPNDDDFDQIFTASLVLASKGYPLSHETNVLIKGITQNHKDITLFYNKVINKKDKYFTNSGRVLTLTTKSENHNVASKNLYDKIHSIYFDGMFYRTDIGKF